VINSYLSHWHNSNSRVLPPNTNFKRIEFLLDFISELGIKSAFPDEVEDSDINGWMSRVLVQNEE